MIGRDTYSETIFENLEVGSSLIIVLGRLSNDVFLRTRWKGKCVHMFERVRQRKTDRQDDRQGTERGYEGDERETYNDF